MTRARSRFVIAIVLLAGMLIGAAANEALSSRELRGLNGREADRQFRRDLLSIMQPMKKYRKGPMRVFNDVWAQTRATATDYESLCQRDTVSLIYRPVERKGSAEDWPMRPAGATAERYYRFIARPTPQQLKAVDHDGYFRSAFDPACRAADRELAGNEWSGWFQARSSGDAMYGGLAMLALADWAKRPGNRFVDCEPGSRERVCTDQIAQDMTLDSIGNVEVCLPRTAERHCLKLGRYGIEFTIFYRPGSPYLRADDIVTVKAEEQIIVTRR